MRQKQLPRSLRCKNHPTKVARIRDLCWGCLKAEQRAKNKESKP